MKRILIALLFPLIFMGLFTVRPVRADSPKVICTYCKQPVQTARYLQIDGNYYCENHFRCANCGKDIAHVEYFKQNGQYYDRDCYLELFGLKCDYCGRPIESDYLTSDGKYYHKECYNNNVATRCALCHAIIDGKYYQDHWGNSYCAVHKGKEPECTYCGRFIGDETSNGGSKYEDGRWCCGICMATAINTVDDMAKLVAEVRAQLLLKGIDIPLDEARNHLVGRDELQQVAERSEPNLQGTAHYKEAKIFFNLLPIVKEADIYILYGMPRWNALSVVAHELMHLWQFQYAKRKAEPTLTEGTCVYASWLLLHDMRTDESEYLMETIDANKDPVYGEGFRRVRAFAESQPIESFLEYLKKNKKLPANR